MEEPSDGDKQQPRNENVPSGPSPDFAALIDAIATEGRAYRSEEQREDKGKTLREWVTVILLGLTMVGVFWQVHEMIKIYGPVKDQAEATQKSADAAVKQSESAEKAFTLSQRAWVGPRNATFSADPIVGKPIEISVEYQNSGREPARGFRFFIEPFSAFVIDDSNGIVGAQLKDYMARCRNTSQWEGGSVIYPSTGGLGGGYTLNVKTTEEFVDEPLIKGEKIAFIQGCFVYRTFDIPKHSYFCYYYKHPATKIQNLNICSSGHDAD